MLKLLFWPFSLPGRLLRKFRSSRTLKLTRDGRYYVGITLGIGLAAINTGNNLLYLLLGWLLSLIIASGFFSNACLRGIRISRSIPKRIYANTPFLVEITASNSKTNLASYSLEVEDICEGVPVDKRCYFLKIPEGKTQHTSYRHTIAKRGLYKFEAVRVSTKFPFGLFVKSRIEETHNELLVFPNTRTIPLPAPSASQHGDSQTQSVGRRGEFYGLREYRIGDDRSSIHWRSSARSNKLLVREYEDESQKQITLLLDNALPSIRGEEEEQALEDAISLCASLAQSYISKGYVLRLIARGQLTPFAGGDMQLQRILRVLALLEIESEDRLFSAQLAPRSESILVVPSAISAKNRPRDVTTLMESNAFS